MHKIPYEGVVGATKRIAAIRAQEIFHREFQA